MGEKFGKYRRHFGDVQAQISQHPLQCVQFLLRRQAGFVSNGPLQLLNQGLEGAVQIVGRAETEYAVARRVRQRILQSTHDARFSDAGLTGKQSGLTLAFHGQTPAPPQHR